MMNPAEFRARLDSALADEPPGPSPGDDMAAGKKLVRRRRTVLAAVSVSVLVAIGLPVGLDTFDRDGDSRPGDPAPSQTTPDPAELRPGWRWESYRDVSLQVPESWPYASPISWCLHPGPAVRRPADIARTVGCPKRYAAYGVRFFAAEGVPDDPVQGVHEFEVPEGWGGLRVLGDTAIQVNAPSREVTEWILESARRIDDVDPYGCWPEVALVRADRVPPVLDKLTSIDSVSVCRYDLGASVDGTDALVQSEMLTGDDAAAALAALQAAPKDETPRVICGHSTDEVVLLRVGDREVWVNWAADCEAIGLLDGPEVRALTADVMHWALSPGWSGAFPVQHVKDHERFTLRGR